MTQGHTVYDPNLGRAAASLRPADRARRSPAGPCDIARRDARTGPTRVVTPVAASVGAPITLYRRDRRERIKQTMAALVDDADREMADVPNSMKGHRACLRCGLVKCFDQFYAEGCENRPSSNWPSGRTASRAA